MEIKFKVKEFTDKITMVSSVISQKNSIPILDSVKIETRDCNARLTGSDSEIWLSVATAVDYCDNCSFCINANDLLKALRNLSDMDEVTMELNQERNLATVYYQSGKFSLPFTDANDYPSPLISSSDMREHKLNASKICNAINSVLYSVGNDPIRPFLNGVHFDFVNDCMVTVSTDTQKLSKHIEYDVESGEEHGFTLQTKASNVLRSVLVNKDNDITILSNGRMLVVEGEDMNMTVVLPVGNYPRYNAVIPQSSSKLVKINKDTILSALKRVTPMGSMNSELVCLHFEDNHVEISAEDVDYSKSAREKCKCEYNYEPMSIGFKGSALLQTISNCNSDVVYIELENEARSGVFHCGNKEEYVSLLMPMLVN